MTVSRYPRDRKATKYFHGRKDQLDRFRNALQDAHAPDRGTLFLIQSPSGAGKTALLEECRRSREKLMGRLPNREGLHEKEIRGASAKGYGEKGAAYYFRKALGKGVLFGHSEIYRIPIPSLCTWPARNGEHYRAPERDEAGWDFG